MALWTDIIQPANVTEFARTAAEALDGQGGTLNDIFPNVQVDDITYSWEVGEVLSEVAEYRSFDAEATLGKSAGRGRKTSELAPVSLKKRLKEYDQYRLRGANSPETLERAAERMAGELATAHVNRAALARGTALVTGHLSINENGFIQDIDFGRRADFTKTAGVLWPADGSDPIEDLEKWLAEYVTANNGVAPTHLIGSRRVQNRAKARMIANGYFGRTEAVNVTNDMVNDQLVDRGLPAFTVNDRQAAGKRVIPDNVVVFASSQGAGGTVWGTTIEAADPRYGLADAGLEIPGLVVGSYREEDPQVVFMRSNAVTLPILANPDLTMVATVL